MCVNLTFFFFFSPVPGDEYVDMKSHLESDSDGGGAEASTTPRRFYAATNLLKGRPDLQA